MRARRLVAVASVAVGLVALSGCRTEPSVAAYVGDHHVTEDAVTGMLDELKATAPTPSASAKGEQSAAPAGPRLPARSQVVSNLVLLDVCQRLSADKGYKPQGQAQPEQVAQQVGFPADTAYVKRVAELTTCMSGLPAAEPVVPTKQELTDIVTAGRAAGAIPAEISDEQASAQLDGDQLRGALGSKKVLADAISAYDVTVNPRYRPLEIPLLSFKAGVPAVSVPLGEAGSAVSDISTPESPAAGSSGPVAS